MAYMHDNEYPPHPPPPIPYAWLVKTLRAPSRHIRDATVYGHTTTYGHAQTEYTPAPSPPQQRV